MSPSLPRRIPEYTLIRAALLLGLVLVATIGVAEYVSVGDLYRAASRERNAEVVLARIEVLNARLRDAAAAQQRYLGDGEAAALSRYRTSRDLALEELAALQALVEESDQTSLVRDLVDAVAGLPPPEVAAAARLTSGAGGVGALRDAAAQAARRFEKAAQSFGKHEREVLAELQQRTAFRADVISSLTVLGSTLSGLLLLWALLALRRYHAHRVLAEEQMRLAQERLNSALAASETAVWDWDVPADRFYLSPEWLRMLGGSAEESYASGRELAALVHREDAEATRASIGRLVSAHALHIEMEYRVRRLDGHWMWIATRGRVTSQAADGTALRASGTNRNITRRKQAEQELVQHDKRLQLALEAATMVGWAWDVEADEFTWQDEPERLLGPSGHGSHLGLQDMVHPEDLVSFIRGLHAAVQTGGAYKDDFRILRRDGKVLWATARGSCERAEGKTVRIAGIVQDVSETKEAEQALARKEQELRLITNAVPAMITYVERSGRLLFCNAPAARLLGMRPQEVIGKTLVEIFGDRTHQFLQPYIARVLSGEEVHFERVHETESGAIDLSVTYVPRFDERGEPAGFFTLASDVSELKRLDRMKSEFVSTVSHELRTPLTSIRGSLGLLAGGVAGALPEKAKGLIDIARNNCERLVRLINDILDMEKIESGKMSLNVQPLELVALVEQAIKANEGFALQHGVRLQMVADVPGGRVAADSDRLTQVLTNLVSNACKFSPSGTSVDVAVLRRADRLRVEITDHGPGISEEFRQRIFQKFSQSDASSAKEKGGTGLGLSISKAIVERLGGAIGFRSEPGSGATFFFELPELRAADAGETAIALTLPRSGDAPCILICEDEPDVAKLLQMMLANAGFASEVAPNAERARALLKERRYAALSLDLRLPDADGLMLLESLRQDAALADLPVVVVSAVAEEGRLKLGQANLGVVDWLEKPIDEKHLIGALRKALVRDQRLRVLHVENDADVRKVVAMLGQGVAEFEGAETLAEARASLARSAFDLVLLDLALPDGSGLELVPVIDRMEPRPRLMIFSARDAAEDSSLGGITFVTKSQASEEQLIDLIRSAVAWRASSHGNVDAAKA